MAEPAKIALLPMMILDQNGHYQTVYAPQSLASLGVPTPGAPPLVPLNSAPGIPNFLSPSHPISAKQTSKKDSNGKGSAPSPGARDGLAKLRTGTKVYVSNLPAGMKDAEFKAFFADFGPVVKATLVKRRRTTTFGFLQFATKEMAQAAIAEKNGTTYEGRTLAVQFADGEKDAPPATRFLRVSNLPAAATKVQVEAIFGRFGILALCAVERVKGQLVTAVLEFLNVEEAAAAQETLHCFCLPDQDAPLEVEFLKSLPESCLSPPRAYVDVSGRLPASAPLLLPPAKPTKSTDHEAAQPSESPTSQLFLRTAGVRHEPEADAIHSPTGFDAMLPLAEYIESMMQHYQLDAPSLLEDQQDTETPSENSNVSNVSWDPSSAPTFGYSDNSGSDSSHTPTANTILAPVAAAGLNSLSGPFRCDSWHGSGGPGSRPQGF
eukprot:EG_transcript_8807